MHHDDILYIDNMNKYINTYDKFKERQIKLFIIDLQQYIQINEYFRQKGIGRNSKILHHRYSIFKG